MLGALVAMTSQITPFLRRISLSTRRTPCFSIQSSGSSIWMASFQTIIRRSFVGAVSPPLVFGRMRLTKMAINQGLDADVRSLMVMEHLAVGNALQSEDGKEGVQAFLQKREPKWVGR